jgi:hypothetical protein
MHVCKEWEPALCAMRYSEFMHVREVRLYCRLVGSSAVYYKATNRSDRMYACHLFSFMWGHKFDSQVLKPPSVQFKALVANAFCPGGADFDALCGQTRVNEQ